MLCAACRQSFDTDFDTCPACRYPGLVDNKYRIDSIKADHGHSLTFAGTRITDGSRVVLRKIAFRPPGADEHLERVRRYGAYIHQITHPSLPVFLHEFPAQDLGGLAQWFVHRFVEGDALDQLVTDRPLSEHTVIRWLFELGPLLRMLHGQSPPAIHQDIRPQHIIRPPEGPVVLTSFALPLPSAWSATDRNLAARSGYRAPEQIREQVTPATDTYGLGATALRLLTARHPMAFFDRAGRLQTRQLHHLTPPMVRVLERMLSPDPDQRPADGAAVCAVLDDAFGGSGHRTRAPQPHRSRKRSASLWRRGLVLVGILASVGVFATMTRTGPPRAPTRHCYVIGNAITDPGLEYRTTRGRPDRTGVWAGHRAAIVSTQGGVMPAEGQAMLSFGALGRSGAQPHIVQLIDLDPKQRSLVRFGQATVVACAKFNRAGADLAQSPFSIHIRGFAGAPRAAADRAGTSPVVSKHIAVTADADPGTWQTACIEVAWNERVDVLQLEIATDKNVLKDRTSAVPARYFVDDACLAVLPR